MEKWSWYTRCLLGGMAGKIQAVHASLQPLDKEQRHRSIEIVMFAIDRTIKSLPPALKLPKTFPTNLSPSLTIKMVQQHK